MTAFLAAELDPWPTKDHLTEILRADGHAVEVGRYAIRLTAFSHFVFRDFGPSSGTVSADDETVEGLCASARLVSAALTKAGVRHRFEVYGEGREMAAYLHHDWPETAISTPEG